MPASLTVQVRLGFSMGWRIWTPNEVGFYAKTLAHSYFILIILKSKFLKKKIWIVNYNLIVGMHKYYIFIEFLKFGLRTKEERTYWKKIMYITLLVQHRRYFLRSGKVRIKKIFRLLGIKRYLLKRYGTRYAKKKWLKFQKKLLIKNLKVRFIRRFEGKYTFESSEANLTYQEHLNHFEMGLQKWKNSHYGFGKLNIKTLWYARGWFLQKGGLNSKKFKKIKIIFKKTRNKRLRFKLKNFLRLKKRTKFSFIAGPKVCSVGKLSLKKKNLHKTMANTFLANLENVKKIKHILPKTLKASKRIDKLSTYSFEKLTIVFPGSLPEIIIEPRVFSIVGGPRKRLSRNLKRTFKGKSLKQVTGLLWFWEKIARLVNYYILYIRHLKKKTNTQVCK